MTLVGRGRRRGRGRSDEQRWDTYIYVRIFRNTGLETELGKRLFIFFSRYGLAELVAGH